MNLWRRFQLFSLRLPISIWIVISLLFSGLSFGISQIQQQKKAAKTAAIQNLSAKVSANNAEFERLKRDISTLEKRGNATALETRALRERLDKQTRDMKIIRSELQAIPRD